MEGGPAYVAVGALQRLDQGVDGPGSLDRAEGDHRLDPHRSVAVFKGGSKSHRGPKSPYTPQAFGGLLADVGFGTRPQELGESFRVSRGLKGPWVD